MSSEDGKTSEALSVSALSETVTAASFGLASPAAQIGTGCIIQMHISIDNKIERIRLFVLVFIIPTSLLSGITRAFLLLLS